MEKEDSQLRLVTENHENRSSDRQSLTADVSLEALRNHIILQIRGIEFLALYRQWIADSDSDTMLSPCFTVLQPYIDAHQDRTAAFRKLEDIMTLWNHEGSKQQTIERMTTGLDEEQVYLVGIRLDRLHSQITDALSEKYSEPFDKLLADIQACRALPESPVRRKFVTALTENLLTLITRHDIVSEDDRTGEDRRFSISEWDQQFYVPRSLHLKTKVAGREEKIRIPRMTEIFEGIARLKFDELLSETLTPVDHQRIGEEALIYGSKGANLREMNRHLAGLQALAERHYFKVEIPRFECIPSNLSIDWKAGKDITEELQPYYEWTQHAEGGVHIRSSAVFSEDNEHATGAGIYETTQIPKGATFEQFIKAVTDVYASVDSERAVAYRKSIDVGDERMGITLMDTVDPYSYSNDIVGKQDNHNRGKGFVNTSRAYAPKLLDIVTEDDSMRPIFIKEELAQCMAPGGFLRDGEQAQFYQVDRLNKHSWGSMHLQEFTACLGYFLEQMYGVPIQCEFVSDGKIIHLVQTRILPEAHRHSATIEFPVEKPFMTRDATGVLNDDLDILPHSEENKEKHGLVIFERSFFAGDLQVDKYFPKSGAVMVLQPSKNIGGHIETLCVEKGLVCIFSSGPEYDRDESEEAEEARIDYGRSVDNLFGSQRLPNVTGIGGHKRVRVIANGTEARIYTPSS